MMIAAWPAANGGWWRTVGAWIVAVGVVLWYFTTGDRAYCGGLWHQRARAGARLSADFRHRTPDRTLLLGYYLAYLLYLILATTQHILVPLFSTAMLGFALPLTLITLIVLLVRHRTLTAAMKP